MMRRGYHVAATFAVGLAFTLALTVDALVHGPPRLIAGYVGSVAFLLSIAVLAVPVVGRWRADNASISPPMIFILASLLLILNVYAGRLDKLFQVHSLGPPRWVVLVVATGWVLILGLIHHRGATPSRIAFGLAWLVVGTRAFALLIFPFHRLPGDMLDAINRSLDLLLAGRFPYVNFPPPMPYLPGTFLAYLPAKLLGLDLRVTNLVLEGATAWMAVRLLSGQDWKSGAVVRRVPMESVLLPFLMLHPTWSHLGANCQFAPTVLTTLLLSRALTSASPLWQGAALGLAVGTNQMIGALAPLAFIYWARRVGGRAAAGGRAGSRGRVGSTRGGYGIACARGTVSDLERPGLRGNRLSAETVFRKRLDGRTSDIATSCRDTVPASNRRPLRPGRWTGLFVRGALTQRRATPQRDGGYALRGNSRSIRHISALLLARDGPRGSRASEDAGYRIFRRCNGRSARGDATSTWSAAGRFVALPTASISTSFRPKSDPHAIGRQELSDHRQSKLGETKPETQTGAAMAGKPGTFGRAVVRKRSGRPFDRKSRRSHFISCPIVSQGRKATFAIVGFRVSFFHEAGEVEGVMTYPYLGGSRASMILWPDGRNDASIPTSAREHGRLHL